MAIVDPPVDPPGRSLVADSRRANRRTARLVATLPAALIGIAALVVLAATGFVVAGVVVGILLGALVWVTAWRGGTFVVLRLTRGREVSAGDQPRLHNLVDGLCAAAGLPKPALYVVDDRGRNALTVGRGARHACLVVSAGLVSDLNRVELEGVLAHELSHLKRDDTLASTVAVTVMAPLLAVVPRSAAAVRSLLLPDREQLADVAATSVTRYPPGLAAALERMCEDPLMHTMSPFAARLTLHLWAAPVAPGGQADAKAVGQRIQALREL